MSLRLRLALFGAAVVALALVLFGLAVYALASRSADTNQDRELSARANAAVGGLAHAPDLTPRPALAPIELRTSAEVFMPSEAPLAKVRQKASNGATVTTDAAIQSEGAIASSSSPALEFARAMALVLGRPAVVDFDQANARAVVQSREQCGVKARR